jgi:transposase
LYRNLASNLLKRLHDQGVSTIYLGYPYNIAQEKGNKFTANLWSYRKLINAIVLKAQEYGMKGTKLLSITRLVLCLPRR